MKLKGIKRLFKTAAVTVVTAAMCFGVVSPAFAAPIENENGVYELPFVKEIKMDENVNLPEMTFDYTITADTDVPNTYMPKITNGTDATAITQIESTDLTKGTADGNGVVTYATNGYEIVLPTAEQYAAMGAGLYTYTITENCDYNKADNETVTHGTQTYKIEVKVENTNSTDPTGDVKVTGIYVSVDGETYDTSNDKLGEVKFTTEYAKTSTETEGALTIHKDVTGGMGDKIRDFQFELTFTRFPNGATQANNIKITGIEEDESLHGLTTVSTGTKYTFDLKDTQEIVITGLPIGTKYTIAEVGNSMDGHTPSAVITTGGVEGSNNPGSKDTTLTVNAVVGDKVADAENADNEAVFTNTRDNITPTGLFIDNLPFILLIVVGAAGIGAYMVSRRRRYQG